MRELLLWLIPASLVVAIVAVVVIDPGKGRAKGRRRRGFDVKRGK